MMLAIAIALSLAASAGPLQGDSAAAAAELLEQRCAVCHAEGSEEPKALKKWAAAKDLVATASDPELVVPGEPDESELFLSVDFDDMPPPESDVAPLTDEEKSVIADWIRAGAVVPEALRPAPEDAAPASSGGKTDSLVVWFSRTHPLIVHFPIALLTAAFLAELLRKARPAWNTGPAAMFCLGLGALSAVPSAGLGWLLAEHTTHAADALDLHRWLGVALAGLALAAWWAATRWPGRRWLVMLVLAGLVGAVGHTGGVLSFGANWLALPF